MSHHLTADRALALKVTAAAKSAADARTLLLALGLIAETQPTQDLAIEPGSTYVPPTRRRREWTRMAGELNASGRTTAQIAETLAVDEDTAAELVGDYWAGVSR